MTHIDAIGWMASGLALGTALMQTMIPLRLLAISSNLAYLIYAVLIGSYPSLVLNCILLPLNLYRLQQMWKLVRDISTTPAGNISADWLAPFSSEEKRRAGETLFSIGDKGDRLYYLCSGRIRFREIGAEIREGTLFGEVAFFIPEGERTQTAVCVTDCRLLSVSERQLKQLYFQNPKFGWYLVQLIAERLSENARRGGMPPPLASARDSSPLLLHERAGVRA